MGTSCGVLTGTKHHGETCCRYQVPAERWLAVDPENFRLIRVFHLNWLNTNFFELKTLYMQCTWPSISSHENSKFSST